MAEKYTRVDYLHDFATITSEMLELTRKKNNDYGGESDPWKNFREFGELGILVRMSDKWARIKSALQEKRELQVSDETVEDTIKDLAVYSIILLIWRRANRREGVPGHCGLVQSDGWKSDGQHGIGVGGTLLWEEKWPK